MPLKARLQRLLERAFLSQKRQSAAILGFPFSMRVRRGGETSKDRKVRLLLSQLHRERQEEEARDEIVTFERVPLCVPMSPSRSFSLPGCYAYCSIYVTIVHPSFRINLAGRRGKRGSEREGGERGRGREKERDDAKESESSATGCRYAGSAF